MNEPLLTRTFFEALHPLMRRLTAERTLSAGKIGVLRHLAQHGQATTSQLATAIHVSPQGISLAVRELERLEFLVRVPDAEDRRRVWINITDAGKQRLAQETLSGNAWLDQVITERLTPQERAALQAVIPILAKLGSEHPHG